MSNPIGQLKSKVSVYCSVCGQKHTRFLKSDIFENTEEEFEKAKAKIRSTIIIDKYGNTDNDRIKAGNVTLFFTNNKNWVC